MILSGSDDRELNTSGFNNKHKDDNNACDDRFNFHENDILKGWIGASYKPSTIVQTNHEDKPKLITGRCYDEEDDGDDNDAVDDGEEEQVVDNEDAEGDETGTLITIMMMSTTLIILVRM